MVYNLCEYEVTYVFRKQTKQSKELLVFLDIDGVLNTSNSFNTKYELHRSNMDVLADLISSGRKMGLEAKVVLTSTWRLGYEADYDKCSPQVKGLIDKLSERGIFIIGKTPLYKGKTRDLEILRYIRGTRYSLATLHHYITNEESEEFEKNGHYIDYSLCKVPALHPQYCVGKIEYLKTLDKSQWHDEMKSMMYEEAELDVNPRQDFLVDPLKLCDKTESAAFDFMSEVRNVYLKAITSIDV